MLFKIFSIDQKKLKYKYFVIMLSEVKPYEIIDKIEQKLRSLKKGKGLVLFDLTLGNLNKDARYIEATFDGENIDIWSFKIVKNVPEFFKKKSFNYLAKNYKYVESSFLTSAEKFRFKNKIFVNN
ncbi:hypothetical protein HNP65_000339 [Thermosipho japonicus]|uniref:Uncharacterized protein n=1 Tax=Thermosipho japonicus TaxID=90323 RepID=A0A841GHS9_9BACT|nr:type II toxin-antitoxin system RnlB family antitoxin [Thermosipho japonicus]MBB6061917.1 hypothetical protein [Thermosipho japonicus]